MPSIVGDLWLGRDWLSKYHRQWTAFNSINQYYYILKLIFKQCSKTVNCVDMTISIRQDRIVTSLYDKAMNLYLYIPPHYVHPLGVLTVIVSGNILCIHSFFINKECINRRMKEFYSRLLVRGYHCYFLNPKFTKGIMGACAFIKHGSVQWWVSYQ